MSYATRWITGVALAGALGFGGCKKPSPPPGAGGGDQPSKPVPATSEWQPRYGFASRIPKGGELYAAYYNLGREYDALLKSRFWGGLSANPLFADLREAVASAKPERKAQTENAIAVTRALIGSEWFFASGPGSAEGIAWLRDIADEINLADTFSGIGVTDSTEKPSKRQEAMAGVLSRRVPELSRAKLAPMLLGFRTGPDRSLVEAALRGVEASLPPETTKSAVEGPDKAAFQSWVFSGASFLEGAGGAAIREKLVTLLGGDEAAAKPLIDALGAQRIEIAHGWVGDYLLISLGADRAALNLAATPADSVLGLPENAVAGEYAAQSLVAFGWVSQVAMEKIQKKFELAALIRQFQPLLVESVGEPEWKRLLADGGKLDAKAGGFWPVPEAVTAFTISEPGGWRTESYGGLRSPAVDWAGKLPAWGLPGSAVIEATASGSDAFGQVLTDWFETLCVTVFDAAKRIAAQKMPPEQAPQIAAVEAIALPKLVELWGILKNELGKSLGSGSALVVDARGQMPKGFPPTMPEGLAGRELLPRIALVREVRDPELLGKSWQSLFTWAQGVYAMVPKSSGMPASLPEAVQVSDRDATIYHYPLPMDTGDLMPHVARIGKDRVIFGTSPKLSSEIASAKPGSAAEPGGSRVRLRTIPAWELAGRWIDAMGEHPEAFFAGKESERDAFLTNRPHLVELFKTLRAIEGLDVRARVESGRLRQTTTLQFKDL